MGIITVPCKGQATRRMPCQPCFSRVVFLFSHFSRETKRCSWSFVRVGVLLCGCAASRSRRETEAAGSEGDTRRPPTWTRGSHLSVPWHPPRSLPCSSSCAPHGIGESWRRSGSWSRPGREGVMGWAAQTPLHQQLRLPGSSLGRAGRGARQPTPGAASPCPSPGRGSCGQGPGVTQPSGGVCGWCSPPSARAAAEGKQQQ